MWIWSTKFYNYIGEDNIINIAFPKYYNQQFLYGGCNSVFLCNSIILHESKNEVVQFKCCMGLLCFNKKMVSGKLKVFISRKMFAFSI